MLVHKISDGEVICDLGSVQGLTSVFLAKEYGFTVYTTDLWSAPVSCDAEVTSVHEMESNDEVWADWLKQDNEYAIGDRRAMEAGGGKYLNFIAIILRKRSENKIAG